MNASIPIQVLHNVQFSQPLSIFDGQSNCFFHICLQIFSGFLSSSSFFFWLRALFALFCRNSCEYFSFLKYVKSHTKMFSGSLHSSVMIAICTSKSLQASCSLLHIRTLTYLEST